MTVEVREFKDADEMMAWYRELKARRAMPLKRPAPIMPVPFVEEAEPVPISSQMEPDELMSCAALIAPCEQPSRHYDVLRVTTLNGAGIIRDVCSKHGVTVADLKSNRRCQELVDARREAFFRLRRETSFSFPQMGKMMGGKDHTTALHAYMSWLNAHPEAVLPSDERALASWRAKIKLGRTRALACWNAKGGAKRRDKAVAL